MALHKNVVFRTEPNRKLVRVNAKTLSTPSHASDRIVQIQLIAGGLCWESWEESAGKEVDNYDGRRWC